MSSATESKGVTRQQVASLLTNVKMTGRKLPTRMVDSGLEGVGKTSFPVGASNPLFLMSRGETGLETLIDSGQVGEVPHLPQIESWNEFLAIIESLIESNHEYKTLVLDAANGFEQLLYEHVCETEFGGKWGKDGFASFHQGYSVSSSYWEAMLNRLDVLREKKQMGIILLAHAKVATFKNPSADDYDRFTPDIHRHQWGLLHRWSDIILFFDYLTVISDDGGKKKGKGGTQRIAHCERRASWDAKNRHGLPENFSLGSTPGEGWANFINALTNKGKTDAR